MSRGNAVPGTSDPQDRELELINELRRLRANEQSVEDELLEIQSLGIGVVPKPSGAASAAVLSVALGVLAIGILTSLAEASSGVSNWLNWYKPTGALSGKTTLGSIIWLVTWLVAHFALKNKELNFTRVAQLSLALILVGLLLMFPPIFELFAG